MEIMTRREKSEVCKKGASYSGRERPIHSAHIALIRLLSLAKSSHCAILQIVDIAVVCMQSAERYTTALSNAVAAWHGLGELV